MVEPQPNIARIRKTFPLRAAVGSNSRNTKSPKPHDIWEMEKCSLKFTDPFFFAKSLAEHLIFGSGIPAPSNSYLQMERRMILWEEQRAFKVSK